MLEKFSLSVSYTVNGSKKVLTTNAMENEHFTIQAAHQSANRLVLDLTPTAGNVIEINNFSVVYQYDFLPRFKQFQIIFANGYQSASSSREYFPNEYTPVFNKKGAIANKGDYAFTESKKKMGFFHSHSYTYLRSNDAIELLASLNEKTGFTVFYLDILAKTITATKDLEGVKIDSRYEVMNITRYYGKYDAAFDSWFKDMHIPKPRVKHLKGYTTWYNYYNKINENVILHDLESISSLDQKIDMFQIDDGYQTAVGDWTITKSAFPNMGSMADAIHEKGIKAGLWLAPFAVSAKSTIYKAHPDWLIKDAKGKPILAGKISDSDCYTLDFYNEEVVAHLKETFNTILNDWGFDMVKLDSLYQVCIVPYNNKSRGEIMEDAMTLLRNIIGDKYILANGVPLVPAFGKVDFCRIGPDMDLKWDSSTKGARERVSIVNNLNNSIFRRHLDGRAFANDTDVFLLRDNNIKLNPNQRRIIATINKIFGSVLFTSDDVSKYKQPWQREFLTEMFSDEEIKILGAEYATNNILHIKYYQGETPTMLTIDMKTGVVFKQVVDPSDLEVSGIDAALAARGGMNYEDALSSEDDNYDDFQFDRELTEEEKAEIADRKKKQEEARQKKIDEMMEKKKAEREALKAEIEAKKAEIEARKQEIEAKNAEREAARAAEIEARKAELEAEREAARKAAAEAKAKAEAEAKAKAEAEAKAKAEAEAKAKAEAEAKAKAEAEAKAKAEAEAKAKAEAEAKAKAEAEAKAKAEAEAKAKAEAEAKADEPATPTKKATPATPTKKAAPATPTKKAAPATPTKKAAPATPAAKKTAAPVTPPVKKTTKAAAPATPPVKKKAAPATPPVKKED